MWIPYGYHVIFLGMTEGDDEHDFCFCQPVFCSDLLKSVNSAIWKSISAQTDQFLGDNAAVKPWVKVGAGLRRWIASSSE